MKHTKHLLLLLLLTWLAACAAKNHGAVNVAVKPQTTFTKNSTITVIPHGEDDLGLQARLKHLLAEKGFEIVSGSDEQLLGGLEKPKSDYLLRFQYETDSDSDLKELKSFSGTIIEVAEGHVVASVNFSGRRSADSFVEEFADELESAMR
jgi:hypothetical protein